MLFRERKAELHVEVLRQPTPSDHSIFIPHAAIEEKILEWLQKTFAGFFINTYVNAPNNDMPPYAHLIESIRIVDYSGPGSPHDYHALDEVTPVVHVYMLREPQEAPKEQRAQKTQHLDLPSKALAGTWDSLMFDTIDPNQILRSLARIIVLMKQSGVNIHALKLNRLVLLHGPPGCGKTTLCRALAQKLSIRLSAHFPTARLIEINTQSLLSKFYSESGRLISELFEKVLTQSRNSDALICVLIDEVESIASSRETLSESGECQDSIRATNQLLTALDRVREQPNVLVFCTSNLKSAIDTAFLDRVDHEVAVPPPCASAVYEILRNTINELIRCGLVTPSASGDGDDGCEGVVPDESVLPDPEDRTTVPAYAKLVYLGAWPESPGRVVAALADKCWGFSGRKLRKLPLLAITMYTWGESCPLRDALDALKRVVDADLSKGGDVDIGTAEAGSKRGEDVVMV